MKIFIASDHAGVDLKSYLISKLSEKGNREFEDLGPHESAVSVDYPDYALEVSKHLQNENDGLGILICGSGIGMSIAANRFEWIRAALVWNLETARLSREHNNANVLCLGARHIHKELAVEMIQAWLSAKFQGGRHQMRIQKLKNCGSV